MACFCTSEHVYSCNLEHCSEVQEQAVYVRFQVLTAASMMFRAVFWVVLPCKIIVDNHFTRQYNPEDSSEQAVYVMQRKVRKIQKYFPRFITCVAGCRRCLEVKQEKSERKL
jgi:hypothetical protein